MEHTMLCINQTECRRMQWGKLAFGKKLSSSPFWTRQRTCCVWSLPIPKLRQWSGTNILSHICLNTHTQACRSSCNMTRRCNAMSWHKIGLLFSCKKEQQRFTFHSNGDALAARVTTFLSSCLTLTVYTLTAYKFQLIFSSTSVFQSITEI